MAKSIAKTVRYDIEDTLDDAVKSLKRAAEDLSEDAETAIGQAADALRKAAEAIVARSGPAQDFVAQVAPQAREIAARARDEVKAHPIASTVAALSAAAALIQILSAARRKAD